MLLAMCVLDLSIAYFGCHFGDALMKIKPVPSLTSAYNDGTMVLTKLH